MIESVQYYGEKYIHGKSKNLSLKVQKTQTNNYGADQLY